MKDESKKYKESEKPEQGQYELDDNALEQAVGGKTGREWAKEAWERFSITDYAKA